MIQGDCDNNVTEYLYPHIIPIPWHLLAMIQIKTRPITYALINKYNKLEC